MWDIYLSFPNAPLSHTILILFCENSSPLQCSAVDLCRKPELLWSAASFSSLRVGNGRLRGAKGELEKYEDACGQLPHSHGFNGGDVQMYCSRPINRRSKQRGAPAPAPLTSSNSNKSNMADAAYFPYSGSFRRLLNRPGIKIKRKKSAQETPHCHAAGPRRHNEGRHKPFPRPVRSALAQSHTLLCLPLHY